MDEPPLITEEEIRAAYEKDPEFARALLDKMQQEIEDRKTPPYVEALFGPQRTFFEDNAARKVALCGRRSGINERTRPAS